MLGVRRSWRNEGPLSGVTVPAEIFTHETRCGMRLLRKLFSDSPFRPLVEHAKKVRACVDLVRPILDALLAGDLEKIRQLHDDMSRTEYEADVIKTRIREELASRFMLSVRRDDLSRYLSYQDDIADAAEDFSVVVSLRETKVHPELREDLETFADQVITVSDKALALADNLVSLSEKGFTGEKAQAMLEDTTQVGEEEWKADRLQRTFARHCYELEDQLDPVTLLFYEKICTTLSAISNTAENAAKFLHMLIAHS